MVRWQPGVPAVMGQGVCIKGRGREPESGSCRGQSGGGETQAVGPGVLVRTESGPQGFHPECLEGLRCCW